MFTAFKAKGYSQEVLSVAVNIRQKNKNLCIKTPAVLTNLDFEHRHKRLFYGSQAHPIFPYINITGQFGKSFFFSYIFPILGLHY